VLDYELLSGDGVTNYTFKGDTTYLIDYLPVFGTATLEGGAVLKLLNVGLIFYDAVPLTCKTTNHLPAVVTCWEDDSVGETISGSGGVPSLVSTCFDFLEGNLDLRNIRFKHTDCAVATSESVTVTGRNLQFVNVTVGFSMQSPTTLNLYNTLAHPVGHVYIGNEVTFRGEHLTVRDATVLGFAYNTNTSSALVRNSLLINHQYPPYYAGPITLDHFFDGDTNDVPMVGVAGGANYLPTNSDARDAGTTNIDAVLAADLRQMTTVAPTVLTGTLSNDLVLAREWIRDTDTPDLGYHYPAVDYLARDLTVGNCKLILTNGVVVAGATDTNWSAITLNPGTLISVGQPQQMNVLVRANQVQEAPQTPCSALLYDGALVESVRPEARLRFTEVSSLAGEPYLIYMGYDFNQFEASHSIFHNGTLYQNMYGGGENQLAGLTNNLFRRMTATCQASAPVSIFAFNNTFAPTGYVSFTGGGTNWIIKDNLFASVALSQDANDLTSDYNAYSGMTGLTPSKLVADTHYSTNSITFTNGPLGSYYVHGTNVLNVGSRNATNAGLYHFTTQVIQDKETNSTVDIGFHYVAVESSGLPKDTDSDGLADYFEDQDGNGSRNGNESSWLVADTDGDGISDYLEYLLGANPNAAGWFNTNNNIRLLIHTPLK
jgi:hypothetical protein